MDCFSHDQRSRIMSCVHSRDTTPEMVVRSFLHRHGLRFRLHAKNLPGHPDIVLPKYKTIVEVRGCFWHRHPGCKLTTTPATHTKFWKTKFERNVERDRNNILALQELGWQVIVVWECETRKKLFPPQALRDFVTANRPGKV